MKNTLLFFCVLLINGGAQAQHTITFPAAATRVAKGGFYHYTCPATDTAGNPVICSVKDLPSWLLFDALTQTISGKAISAGQYHLQIIAVAKTDTGRQSFMLTVYDANTVNILCLGNSITNGTASFNSYRRPLWQLLHQGRYNIDFIGSWSGHHMGGAVPDPDFDMDHEGHSGWNAQDIFSPPQWDSARGNIYSWLKINAPHIVLIELGTNDIFQCRQDTAVINNLKDAIALFRERRTTVKIFIAQVPPLGKAWSDKKLCGDSTDYATRIIALNKALTLFVKLVDTDQSPVKVVDQFTGIDPATSMYDDIHPNDAGEKIMAQRWFNAIVPYLQKL